LDDFGLFAALRWQLKRTWFNSAVVSRETYPNVEPVFEPDTAIVLLRIAQEALSIARLRVSVKSSDLSVRRDATNFWMRFSDDGTSIPGKHSEDPAMIMASMRHRIRVLGGRIEYSESEANAVTVWMPLRPGATNV
jgi:signal transduction histidine kinase